MKLLSLGGLSAYTKYEVLSLLRLTDENRILQFVYLVIYYFWGNFSFLIISLKFVYNNDILRSYIIFIILSVSFKNISIVSYNMKIQSIYIYNFNQNN